MTRINPIQLQKYLKGMDYPADKQDLVNLAKKNGAERRILAALEELPEKEFETPAEVSKAVAKLED